MDMSSYGRTDNTSKALVAWDGLPMIAFSSFKRLGQIDSRLLCLSLEVELVYAALCDH